MLKPLILLLGTILSVSEPKPDNDIEKNESAELKNNNAYIDTFDMTFEEVMENKFLEKFIISDMYTNLPVRSEKDKFKAVYLD